MYLVRFQARLLSGQAVGDAAGRPAPLLLAASGIRSVPVLNVSSGSEMKTRSPVQLRDSVALQWGAALQPARAATGGVAK